MCKSQEIQATFRKAIQKAEKNGILGGLPWQSSGQDSTLPLQEVQVWYLVGELRCCMLCSQRGKKIWYPVLKTARTFFIFSQWVLSYQLEWNIVTEYINVYKVELNQWRLCQQSKCRSKDSHRGSEAMVQSSGAYREGALPRSLNIGFALAESSATVQRR